MGRITSQREGFALAAAIMALVLVGALVTGGFYAASQESRISDSTRFSVEAFNIAEYGLNEVVGGWTVDQYDDYASNSPVTGTVSAGGSALGTYTVDVSPLGTSGELFAVRSTGQVAQHGFRNSPERTLAMIVRTNTFDIEMDRAVAVYGELSVKGNAKVSGTDIVPEKFPSRGDCTDLGDMAGVVARDTSLVDGQKSSSISGDPPKREDPSLDSLSFNKFGDWDYEELAAMATWTFTDSDNPVNYTQPSLTSDGFCNYGDRRNWGAPEDSTHACRNYFPIIHATGSSLTLNGNKAGQGILLVDGDLDLGGGYRFYGIVIVKGRLTVGAGSAEVYGTTYVWGGGDLGEESILSGTPVVNFSSCAVDRAIRNNDAFARAYPIASRSWFDLSAAGAGT